ncbi:MAG: hypothetical protein F4Y05_01425 [Acidimicrobiaceae bacterium]|nr:hypothetical protein [Acidimicrobiaceae bacterium]
MTAIRTGILSTLVVLAVVCTACGGGTAGTGGDDGTFEAASESATTTVPEPEAADGSATTTVPEPEAADGSASTTVPEPEAADGSTTTTVPEPEATLEQPDDGGKDRDGAGDDVASATTVPEPQNEEPTAVRRVVLALEAPELVPFTDMGETRELRVSANYSDGSREAVDSALVEWQSSDPWVVSVSEGLVTAVGGGNATITAAHEGRTVEVPASVRISTRSARSVRVIYAAPSDREFRADMSEHLANVTVDLQSWYRRELDGLTFSLYEATPEECRMSEPADYYVRGNAWEKVIEGLQSCAPVQHGTPDFIWVVYPILSEPCDEPQELGAGGWGLTIMPENDGPPVLGLVQDECGEGSYFVTPGHKIGGPGHELAHTMGVPHPPGCDAGLPTCDHAALISSGYVDYPDTYLRADNKEVLIRSPFIGTEPVPERGPSGASTASSVNGVALGSDGEPVGGLRVSLVAESFWSWGETGEDGTFAVRVPEGSSGPSIVSIHAGDAGDCRWLGYHGPDGVTTARSLATRVDAGNGNVTGIEIRLPVGADDLCPDTRKVTGTVLGPDGRPAEGIWLWLAAVEGWLRVGNDGSFEFSVPEDWTGSSYVLSIQVPEVEDCGEVGYFGSDGFTTRYPEASLEMSGIGGTGIEIRLPAGADELCRGRITLTGEVLDPDGEPLEGIWIGLLTETGFYPWEWGQTGPDGTFEIRLLGAWSDSLLLAVHAAEVAWPCNLLGYHGPDGFTAARETATRLEAGDVDASGIEIRLPASPDQLLPYRVGGWRCSGPVGNPAALDSAVGDRPEIRGTLVGPDGQPLAGILIWAWSGDIDSSGSTVTSDSGAFAVSVPDGTFTLDIYAAADGSCAGWYDGASVTSNYSEAVRIDVAGQDMSGITIRLPALPQDLPSGQC